MKNNSLKIVSWNIAGAHRINSAKMFDYGKEDITYFSDQLKPLSPDIICLQETHVEGDKDIAHTIAAELNMPYIYEVDASPSHIDSTKRLGNAVISKYELREHSTIVYPSPHFTLTFADGRPAQKHDKVMQALSLGNITIANTQMLPLQIFGKSYAEGEGAELAKEIDALISRNVSSPAIVCGDFNYNDAESVYTKLFEMAKLRDTLPGGPTRPNGAKTDYILTSQEFTTLKSGIQPGEADHFLCFAEIDISRLN